MITSFSWYDLDTPEQGAVSIKGISENKELTLSYRNNIFSIGFAALSYRESHKNKYAYQLEGFTDHWIQLGTEHQVTFTNLAPGSYTFRVKGANNDGIWNEEPTEIKIIITPPWWKTRLAYAIYILAFLAAIYALRNYELSREQLKHELEIGQLEAEKLKELDEMKSRFFANISHDFRTPLTLILGPLENLMSNAFKQDVNRQYVIMRRNAQRLLRLINQLLDISKLEAGKMTLKARHDDIIPFIKGVFYAFESLTQRKNIRLLFETEMEEARLYFDPDKMEQVIVNILSNAFKFTPKDGTINVRVTPVELEQQRPFLQIEITDTGSGINADQLPHVFDRFYQANKSFRKNSQGSGIGLSLTKELVELHRGRISLKSIVGLGAQFTILLPFGNAHLQAEEIIEGRIDSPSPARETNVEFSFEDDFEIVNETLSEKSVSLPAFAHKAVRDGSHILLVEDNADMRAFIRYPLKT